MIVSMALLGLLLIVWDHISCQHSHGNRTLRRLVIICHAALLEVEVVFLVVAHNFWLLFHDL